MVRSRRLTLILAALILLPVCAAQPQAPAEPENRRIAPGNGLEITVRGESELSGMVVVRSDGRITLPLVDDVHAAGLTFKELQALLEAKLKPFLALPRVTVSAAQGSAMPLSKIRSVEDRPWLLPDLWPVL